MAKRYNKKRFSKRRKYLRKQLGGEQLEVQPLGGEEVRALARSQVCMREVVMECCVRYAIVVPEDWSPKQIEEDCNNNWGSADMVRHVIGGLEDFLSKDIYPSSYIKWHYLREVEEAKIEEITKEQDIDS